MEDQVCGLGDEGEGVGVVLPGVGVEDHIFIGVGDRIGGPHLVMVVVVDLVD